MAWMEKLNQPEQLVKNFLKWGLLGLIMGVLGGQRRTKITEGCRPV